MKVELLDLRRNFNSIKEEVQVAVNEVFDKCSFIMGENVKAFEQEFSNYLGAKHSIAVGNGTDALILALVALGIGNGDEVITTPYTFFATPEAIARVGAVPVFVDVRLDTLNIDENKIEEKITEKTKAIMPVHIFGHPCEMDKINEIAKKHHLYVIEDAAQAISSSYKGKMVGTLSDIACFSFHPTKNLGAAGDAGMIVTNDDYLNHCCRALRVHGSGEHGEAVYNQKHNIKESKINEAGADHTVYNPYKYHNYLVGFNSRLDEIQAAVLRIKLRQLTDYTKRHREIAAYYNKSFKDTELIIPVEIPQCFHIYHQYLIRSEKRDDLMKKLAAQGVQTGIYYPLPMNRQKAFEDLPSSVDVCYNADLLAATSLALPLYAELTDEEMEYVATAVLSSL